MYGAKATFSVWEPIVEKGDEMSISQIWITSGQYGTNDLNSIEVGWQVRLKIMACYYVSIFFSYTYKTVTFILIISSF